MSRLISLALRRWRTFVRAHIAAVVITIAVTSAWMLFWGYAEAKGQAMNGRVRVPEFPAEVILEFPSSAYYSVPSYASVEIYSYKRVEAGTPWGPQPVAVMTWALPSSPLFMPKPGEVWLPESMQQDWQIAVGDQFTLRFNTDFERQTVLTTVAGFYPALQYDPALLVNNNWLTAQGVNLTAPLRVLVQKTRPDAFDRWLRSESSQVRVISADMVLQQARQVVRGTLSNGQGAAFILFLFLTLGVGTFSLLTFMDSRRELSLLKSMGLRPLEVGALFILESVFTASLGFVLALLLTSAVIPWMTLPVVLNIGVALRALLCLVISFALASGVPRILAKRGTVTELMLNRPIPLLSSEVAALARRYPALEAKLQAGYSCVKLPTVDGEFQGICFRSVGQPVKKGETIAWESLAWGLAEKKYVAPCDGQVEECDLVSGVLFIKPANL